MKPTKRAHSARFRDDVFKGQVLILINEDPHILQKYVDMDIPEDIILAARTVNLGNSVIIWFHPKYFSEKIVAHEAIHAALFILHSRGLDNLDSDASCEALTYYVEWLVGKISKRFRNLYQ